MSVLHIVLGTLLAATALTLCIPPGPHDEPIDPDDRPTVLALRIFRILLVLAVIGLVWLASRNHDVATYREAASPESPNALCWRSP
jgi:hypothetical protein